MRRSALYAGSLLHVRADAHAKRTFRYPVYVASIDLDELPALDRELRLFSHGRRNLFSLDDRDYTTRPSDVLAGEGLPRPATTRLITNLRVAGYVFNPVSFFLGYDASGAIASVIAEVNNTYGGNFRYVLGPAQRVAASVPTFRHVREFFVSPFLHGPASYDFEFDAPLDGDELAIAMRVHASPTNVGRAAPPEAVQRSMTGHQIFYARLTGTRRPLTDRALAVAALRYPLMTAQVIGLIHFEALKLRLAGVPYRRPGPDHRPLDQLPSYGDR
jgi:DUF1365 family protein